MDEKNRKYSNDDITVYWKPLECIHSTICYKNLLEVFNPSKRPWINMKGATTDEIIDIVKKCPTDALTFTFNDNKPSSKAPEKNEIEFQAEDRSTSETVKIDVIKGGPLLVEGEVTIKGPDGEEFKKPKIAYFCRCGQSKRMPFCDGTHRKIGFDK
ncbi:(4Fe-4S)-binding protein [Bacteroidota bacterium]